MKRDPRLVNKQRFDRQFRIFSARLPLLERLRRPGWMILRIVLGAVFILGGLLAILPVFNLWMIPIGLLLLAIDLPLLQGPVNRALIRGRRTLRRLRHRRQK